MGAELDLDHQINYIDSILFYDTYLNKSQGVILKEIRKSLVELKELKFEKN
jgi:hypothetical protein